MGTFKSKIPKLLTSNKLKNFIIVNGMFDDIAIELDYIKPIHDIYDTNQYELSLKIFEVNKKNYSLKLKTIIEIEEEKTMFTNNPLSYEIKFIKIKENLKVNIKIKDNKINVTKVLWCFQELINLYLENEFKLYSLKVIMKIKMEDVLNEKE
jgi:hypothetical protein